MRLINDLVLSANMVFYLLVSISFVVGLILMVSPEAFGKLNKALQREYGLRKRLVPNIEEKSYDVIDKTLSKHSVLSGMIISIIAFVLLMIYK